MHTKRVLVFVVLLLIVLTTLICVESLVHGRGRAKSVKDHEVLNVKSQHKHSLPSIPKLIIRTGEPEQKDLHPDVADLYAKTDRDNPGYITQYFSGRQCRLFLCANFDRRVVRAYDKLIPGAYRADLFRYCAVYTLGGIYVDFSSQFLVPIDSLVDCKHDALVLCHDRSGKAQRMLFNAVFAAHAKHPLLKMCIDRVVSNTENNFYGRNALHPTGPLLMREVFDLYREQNPQAGVRLELAHSAHNTISRLDSDMQAVILHKLAVHRLAVVGKTSMPGYGDLWQAKSIYHGNIQSPYKYLHLENIYIKNSSLSTIPKIIIRTGVLEQYDLSDYVKALHRTEPMNSAWSTKYFSDKQCREFIKANFEPAVLAAYDTLIPGAYKADLFRYCAVYILGGLYIDFTGSFVAPIETFVGCHDELVLCHDFSHGGFLMLYNAVFAASPRHVFLRMCIDRVVQNVQNKFYGLNPLHPTGPMMFREVYDEFTTAYPNAPHRLQLVHAHKPNHISFSTDQLDKLVLYTKAPTERQHRVSLGGTAVYYANSWHKRQAYRGHVPTT